MSNTTMKTTDVTVVVVPRERFSYSLPSLNSLYLNTEHPFRLIYIDGNSPPVLSRTLQELAVEKDFHLIRSDHYLSPNAARNLALPYVQTKYLVFIDNDVIVRPGWLHHLIACADQNACTAVCPLTFEDEAFSVVHHAGGYFEWRSRNQGTRWLNERRPLHHLPLSKVKHTLIAGPTDFNEFHCVLVRTDFFECNGALDESLLSMAEETDFALSVSNHGGLMFFEPLSNVSYIPPSPDHLLESDLPFFNLRWCSDWTRKSVRHMIKKYNLDPYSPAPLHWLRFVYDHRHYCSTGSKKMPSQYILFGDYAASLSKREKIDRLFENLSPWPISGPVGTPD
jgi:GT2 family glycosyltransferase